MTDALAARIAGLLRDVDEGFSYEMPPERNPVGGYEIELVVQKIALPFYADRLHAPAVADKVVEFYAGLVTDVARAGDDAAATWKADTMRVLSGLPLPPFQSLARFFPKDVDMDAVRGVLRQLVETAPFDEAAYLARYKDINAAVQAGRLKSGKAHFINHGYFHNRAAQPMSSLFD